MTIERWDPFREMIGLCDAIYVLLAESVVRANGPATRSRRSPSLSSRAGGGHNRSSYHFALINHGNEGFVP